MCGSENQVGQFVVANDYTDYTVLQPGFFLEPGWVSPGFWPIPPSLFSLVYIHAYGFLFVQLCI